VNYRNGRVKSVEHCHGNMGAPKKLERLEDEIDRVVGTEERVGER